MAAHKERITERSKEGFMTKAELIERIAKNKALRGDVTKKAVATVVDTLFTEVRRSITKDGRFAYPDFGTFEKRKRKARKGVNPQTGKPIKIPASQTVAFRPASALKKAVGGRRK
jgi:DNA-binding protein HU-beta